MCFFNNFYVISAMTSNKFENPTTIKNYCESKSQPRIRFATSRSTSTLYLRCLQISSKILRISSPIRSHPMIVRIQKRLLKNKFFGVLLNSDIADITNVLITSSSLKSLNFRHFLILNMKFVRDLLEIIV